MQIRLSDVRREPFRWDETREIDPNELDRADLVDIGPVRWRGSLRFVDPGYLVEGRYGYEQRLECVRCLEPFTEAVKGTVEVLFLVDPDEGVEEERQLEEEELGVVVVADDLQEIDLGRVLLEQLQLEVPMTPRCRPGCAGICPECGTNLNESSCECEPETGDPRWAALEKIKTRMDDDD